MNSFLVLIFLLISNVKNQFIQEFHIQENTMIYKTILNLNQLLISKNKIETIKARESKIYMSTVINSGLFSLDSDTNLKVTKHIDREELCPPHILLQTINLCGSIEICCHILEFQVSYKNEDDQSYFLKVFIDDENDNKPIFPIVPTPFCVIEENKPIGFKIQLPKAQDLDNETFSISYYKLQTPFIHGNFSDFELGQESKRSAPFLIIASSLNREKISKYTFNLIAYDGVEGNRNSGQTEITIKILDVNDNAPRFERHIYLITLKEHIVPDPIFDISVTDEDEDDNGRLELSIVDNGQSWPIQNFNLDVTENIVGRLRAQIRTTITLDYEQPPNFYEFKLVARDKGRNPLSSTATIRIQIININDMGPEIRFVRNGRQITTGFTILEGTPGNVMLAHVQVSDADSSISQLQCTLRSLESILMLEESRFRHPANLYKQFTLRTTQSIDREALHNQGLSDSKILVRVQCFDHDSERPISSNVSIFILVSDINDNAPKFTHSQYHGYLDENMSNQEIKIHPTIIATDKDLGLNAKLSYFLKDYKNKSDSLFFRIDPENGKIYNNQAFDFEKKVVFIFLILAQDHGIPTHLSASSTVTIRIRDKNDNAPKFEKSHFTFSVLENVEIGYLIGTLNATDKDTLPSNKEVRYYIKNDLQKRANGYISLDSISGQIRTRQPIDREKVATITFISEVRNPSRIEFDSLQEAMIVITILDVNDSPPTFRLIDSTKSQLVVYLEVLEHSQVCEPIPFIIEDADDNTKSGLCCDVKIKNNYEGLLSISLESQTVICINKVPLHKRSLHVTLIATDRNGNGNMTGEGSFTIIIKNDPNIIKKSKINSQNNGSKKPQPRKDDIRQITLITILASLAGICLLIIIIIVIISQKRCDRFNIDNENEKNNDNNSQPMMERQCTIRKNNLENSPFNEMISTSHGNYYNAMQPIYHPQSLDSIHFSKYELSPDRSLLEDYTRTVELTNKYQHLQRSDDSYQMLNKILVEHNQYMDNIPGKIPTKSKDNHSNSDLVNTPSNISQSCAVSVTNSINRCNQTTFV